MARGDRRRVPSRDQGDSTRDRIADDRPEIERLRRTRAFQRCAGSSLSTRCPIDEKLSPDLIAADALSLFFALAPRARVAPGENYRRRDPSGITRVWLQVRRFCRRPGSLVSTMQRDRRPAIAILSTWETSPRIPGPADGVFLNSRPMRRSIRFGGVLASRDADLFAGYFIRRKRLHSFPCIVHEPRRGITSPRH